jgi:hypothetical protein
MDKAPYLVPFRYLNIPPVDPSPYIQNTRAENFVVGVEEIGYFERRVFDAF